MNLKAQSILSKFHQKREIEFLSIVNLSSNEEEILLEDSQQEPVQKSLLESIRASISISESGVIDVLNIEGENSTFIKSLGNDLYLILSLPSSRLNVSEVRFFLTNFSLNYQEQGELVN